MAIRVTCPDCGEVYDLSADLAGKRIRCGGCKGVLTVPVSASPRAAGGRSTASPRKSTPPPGPARRSPARPARDDDDSPRRSRANAERASRRRMEEEDDPPRRRSARAEKAKRSPAVLIGISAGGVLLVGAAVAVVIWASTSGKPDDFRASAPPRNIPAPPVMNVDNTPAVPANPAATSAPAPADDHLTSNAPPPPATNDVASAPAGGQAAGGRRIYDRLLRSAVLIFNLNIRGNRIESVMQGSGTLIDKTNRLVLTNYHVVGHSARVVVFFPSWRNGKLLAEPDYFFRAAREKKDGLQGLVLKRDPSHDLALVQLDKLPSGVEALPFASVRSNVGEPVYSIGNAGAADGFWIYTHGEIRQFLRDERMNIRGDGGETFTLQSDVILTDSPTNQGDSGGPLVNPRAEMIGVTQSLVNNARALSFFIDLTEVRKFLDLYSRQAGVSLALATGPGIHGSAGASAEDLPTLIKNLEDSDQQVRLKAVTKLGEQGADAKLAVGPLLRCLRNSNATLRSFIRDTLTKIGPPAEGDVPAILDVLDDADTAVRLAAVDELAQAGSSARNAVTALARNLKDHNDQVRRHVAQAIAKIGVSDSDRDTLLPKFSEALRDRDQAVRAAVAQVMAQFSFSRADVAMLTRYLTETDANVLTFAARALGKVGPAAKSTVPALIAAFAKASDTAVKAAVMQALAGIGSGAKEAVPQIREALASGDLEVRRSAVQAAAVLGDSAGDTLPLLADALKEPKLRDATIDAVKRLGHAADDATVVSALVDLLSDKKVQVQVIDTLKAIAPKEKQSASIAAAGLVRLLENRLISFRNKVENALAALGKPAVVPLTQALSDADPAVRAGAADALGQLGPVAKSSKCIRALGIAARTDNNLKVRIACQSALVRIQTR